MTQTPRPVVSPSPDAAIFWDAASRQELMLPFCRGCRCHFFYPRSVCPSCGSRDLEWVRASGHAELYSFCIHHHTGIRELREAVPFVTALVTLREGPRMMTYLVGVKPEPQAIQCGMPLEVTFIEAADGRTIPAFKPRG
jgi:hypothetical protein